MNKCCCDCFNKQADWPVAGHDNVSQDNKTKNAGKKKGYVRGFACQTERKKDMQKR